jgi:Tol biopolymer transport system component
MRHLLLFIAFTCCISLSAQDLGKGWKSDKKGQEKFFLAEELFYNQNFLNALEIYRELEVTYPDADILKFRIGVCLLHKTDEVDQSLGYLEAVKQKNPKALDIDYYIACAYHLTRQYDKALTSIDAVLANKKTTPETKVKAERLREYCNNAIELEKDPVAVEIRNVGAPVNSNASEYVPVVTSDDSVMFFTYVGDGSVGGLQAYPGQPDSGGIYFEDIYMSKRNRNDWLKPEPLGFQINTAGHDAAVGLSNDGQTMIIYKDESGGGDLFLSHLDGEQWSVPQPIEGDVNTGAWEGHATFSADMRVMYFASERSGGYGGRDIWMATLGDDGKWGNVRNLGPKVNTAEDEDSPFLHPNGLILMFNSEGHNSMGGYDIFQTELTPKDSMWSEPGEAQNLGYPVNTPGDDKYFVLGLDGKHGYYSSGVAGGKGQQDIYLINGDLRVKNPRICQLTGLVTLDSVPMKSVIMVRDDMGQLRTFYLESNSESGKYLVNLPAGREYTVTCEMMGYERKFSKVDAPNAENMSRMTRDFHFFSPGYLERMKRDSTKTDSVPSVKPLDPPVVQTPKDSTVRRVDPADYGAIVSKFGSAKAEGMYFRVQVAAYNFPNNYSYNHLSTIGTIDRIVLDDGVTRFTMGKFETLAEAEAYRQRIVAAGQTDAFVTAERNGKRYLLRELVELNFFQPK